MVNIVPVTASTGRLAAPCPATSAPSPTAITAAMPTAINTTCAWPMASSVMSSQRLAR
jgi:hypothetical protein